MKSATDGQKLIFRENNEIIVRIIRLGIFNSIWTEQIFIIGFYCYDEKRIRVNDKFFLIKNFKNANFWELISGGASRGA